MTDLEDRFAYYRPTSKEVAAKFPTLRGACRDLANLIQSSTLISREQSLALTKLEEVMFWANAAVARNEGEIIPDSVDEPSPKSYDD